MNKVIFWKRVSNFSAVFCGITALVDSFFHKYLKQLGLQMMYFLIIFISLFLIAELLKLILRNK